MFIAHGEKFRKHARWIMAAVLILLIPGFIALFTHTGSSTRQATDELPTIGGKPVNPAEFENALNSAKILFTISTGRAPDRSPEMQDRLTQEAVLRILMLDKARELGIRVADSEVVQAIRSQPMLLDENGRFDPERYRRFAIYLMNNVGISEARYEQILREELTRAKLEQMITAGALAAPQEVNLLYTPYHERIKVALVKFDVADYQQPLTVSNEEARAFYDAHQQEFRTPAQVKVRYARFTIADSEPTIRLTDEEIADYYERNKQKYAGTNNVAPPLQSVKEQVRKELLAYRADRAAADRATAFSVALVPKSGEPRPDFAAVCKEFGVEPHETDFFSQLDPPVGATDSVAFIQQAFALGPEVPTSDPVPARDGYFVLEYLDSKPSVIPSFEEVKDKVIDQIKQERIREATLRHGQDAAAQLKQLVAGGKSFTEACAELKLKVETPPPLSFADEKVELPFAQRILEAALGMPVGAVSPFIPTLSGGVVFLLQERQPPDPATAEKDRPRWAQRVLQQNQHGLFQMWINHYAREQGVDLGRRHREAVTPEPTDAEPS